MNTTMRAPLNVCNRCHQAQAKRTLWNCRLHVFIVMILVGGFHPSPAMAQIVTQCQENEVLLEIQVSYQPTDINEYLDISIQGRRRVNTSEANQSNIESFSYYQQLMENGTMVTDNNISLCVPDDQCLVAVVKLFSPFPVYREYRYSVPPDDIFIVYNGQVWSDKNGSFAYSTSGTMVVAELGPCEVVCEWDEALLEIEAVTGFDSEYDWQILDDATGQIIEHCPGPFQNSSGCYWESEQYYHERRCLPREGCYTLLVGERSGDVFEYDTKSLVVYFDGYIDTFEYLQFISVPFSDISATCSGTYCDSDSSLVELYFFREDMDFGANRNLSWSLSSVDGSALSTDLGTGIIASGDRALQYHRECIPKVDYCVQLSTWVAEDDVGASSSPFGILNVTSLEEGDYQENITFRFQVDGIIYSDYYYEFGYTDEFVNGTFELAYYAGDCSSSQICGNNNDFHVFQVDVLTQPYWQTSAVVFQVMSRSAGQEAGIDYNLAPLYPDQKYRFFSCIPESWLLQNNPDPEYCTEFAFNGLQLFDGSGSFNISIDGVPFMGQQTAGTGIYYGTYGEVTRLAGQCEVGSSSEGGLRIGVIVACVVVVAILGGLVWCTLQTQGDQSTSSAPRPTGSPEATAIAIPIVDDEYPTEPWKNSTSVPPGSLETTAIAIPIFEEQQQRETEISCTLFTPQGCEGTNSGSNDNAVCGSVHDAQA